MTNTHPAYGLASVHRVSSTGTHLFDSDITHSSFMELTFRQAKRDRDAYRDWITDTSGPGLLRVQMSEAQWASFVSSINTNGVPCTVISTEKTPRVAEVPHEPRLKHSQDAVRDAADRAFRKIKEARDTYEAKKNAANLRDLHSAIENAAENVAYAASTLTEHAENVVQRARADIEAVVAQHSTALGVEKLLELE